MLIDARSVRTGVVVLTVALILFITLGMLLFNTQMLSVSSRNNQLEEYARLNGAVWNIERLLNTLSHFLDNYIADAELSASGMSPQDAALWSRYLNIQRELSRAMPLQPSIGCIYLYFNDTDYLLTVIGQSHSSRLSRGKYEFWRWSSENRPPYRRWRLQEWDDTQMLAYSVRKDAVDITLLAPLDALLGSQGDLRADAVIAAEGVAPFLYKAGGTKGTRLVGDEPIDASEVRHYALGDLEMDLYLRDPKELSYEKSGLFVGLSLAIIASVVLMSLAMNRWILKPVVMLRRAFQEVRSGNLAYRIPEINAPSEFAYLNGSFNALVSEIQNTKYVSYRSELRLRKEELRSLHRQMRPHFILNCLNMIHALTYHQECAKIRQMTVYLSSYLRYIASQSLDLDTLGNELAAFEDYMNIEKLMHPNQAVTYGVSCDANLYDRRILTMMILSAAENAMKHGFVAGKPFHVAVDVRLEGRSLCVRVSDNGVGFSKESLDALAREDEPRGSQHLGLRNIQKRLQLLYGGEARFHIENAPDGGAVMEVVMPDETREKEALSGDEYPAG